MHHAEHGCEYTSVESTNRLADWNLAGTCGSVGDCFDCEKDGGVVGSGLTPATTGRRVPLR